MLSKGELDQFRSSFGSKGGGANMPKLNVKPLQLSIEGLLKLLGGSEEDRWRFIEIITGLTSRAEFQLSQSAILGSAQQINTIAANIKSMNALARKQVGAKGAKKSAKKRASR
jgi:hypothetical protein